MNWRNHRHFLRAVIESSAARQHLGPVDPRLVHGWLAEKHGPDLLTLEAGNVDSDVRSAVAAINADPATSEQVATTHGL